MSKFAQHLFCGKANGKGGAWSRSVKVASARPVTLGKVNVTVTLECGHKYTESATSAYVDWPAYMTCFQCREAACR
jgi:hypothetical protein